jgi:hypothetical protein
MIDGTSEPEKKIIVDEDWKSQVEKERDAARGTGQAAKPAEAVPEPPPTRSAGTPPPSLTYLASTLYLQGAIALGLLPHPVSGKPETNFPQARHAIDTLEILQQKTEGNRTADETEEIEAMLHQLRLAFVEVQSRGPNA